MPRPPARPLPLVLVLVALALAALAPLGGCTRVRFVIDAVPADDALTESVVIDDRPSRSMFRPTQKVALIDVNGLIQDARRGGYLGDGENPVALFTESLRRAERDRNVRALVVRINSPGGTVTASDVLYRELNRFRERTEKPVVVLMADVAASGGFYLACAGDEIIAHPSTITGSIGVIMQLINVSEGMQRIGISAESITSGPNKSMGSPFEPMPHEHRELLQGVVNEFYAAFLDVVVTRREGVAPDQLEAVTDGRIVTGRRAAEIGLVDRVGDLHDAYAAAKERAGVLKGHLVKYHRPLNHVGSAYAAAPAAPPQLNIVQLNLGETGLLDRAGFYYLWDPAAWRRR